MQSAHAWQSRKGDHREDLDTSGNTNPRSRQGPEFVPGDQNRFNQRQRQTHRKASLSQSPILNNLRNIAVATSLQRFRSSSCSQWVVCGAFILGIAWIYANSDLDLCSTDVFSWIVTPFLAFQSCQRVNARMIVHHFCGIAIFRGFKVQFWCKVAAFQFH